MRRLAVANEELNNRPWADGGSLMSTGEFHDWWAERHRAGHFSVERIPFSQLTNWHFEPAPGNLGHDSGRFFTVEGLHIRNGGVQTWAQPIINQPEIGILGIVVKEF